jgi:hypothetical protein
MKYEKTMKQCQLPPFLLAIFFAWPISSSSDINSGKLAFELGEPYVRIQEQGAIGELLLSSKTFKNRNGQGPKITLMAVTHVAEKDFYEKINIHLQSADKILFEEQSIDDNKSFFASPSCMKFLSLFANDNLLVELDLVSQESVLRIPPGRGMASDRITESMMDWVVGSSEGQQILRSRAEPVSPSSSYSRRCDSFLKIIDESFKEMETYLRRTGELVGSVRLPGLIGASKVELRQLIKALEGGAADRRSYAKMMVDRTNSLHKMGPATNLFHKGLLEFRNEAPLQDILVEMRRSPNDELVILYGGAHMSHMERELVRRYEYVPDSEKRYTAWSYQISDSKALANFDIEI